MIPANDVVIGVQMAKEQGATLIEWALLWALIALVFFGGFALAGFNF